MSQGKRDISYTQFFGYLRSYTEEAKRGFSGWEIGHFKVLPSNSVTPTRANRFHSRLFGRETGSITLVAIGLALYVRNLSWSINSMDELSAEAFDSSSNSRNL